MTQRGEKQSDIIVLNLDWMKHIKTAHSFHCCNGLPVHRTKRCEACHHCLMPTKIEQAFSLGSYYQHLTFYIPKRHTLMDTGVSSSQWVHQTLNHLFMHIHLHLFPHLAGHMKLRKSEFKSKLFSLPTVPV